MRRCGLVLGAVIISANSYADTWNFTPHIYARGGYTLSPDFTGHSSNEPSELEKIWNFGPWQSESNIFAPPLTELTLEAGYGEEFKFFYGFDVQNNNRFINGSPAALQERVAYLEYYQGDMSLWFGSRPYRSEAEYLSRVYSFDEKNLYGGGIRLERLGPSNIELAYGIAENSYGNDPSVYEQVSFLINKVELPLENGLLKSQLEIQQHRRRSIDSSFNANQHGYMFGINYKRWGDRVFGGNLYNNLLVHYGKGLLIRHHMGSLFASSQDAWDKKFDADKLLIQWNGDWKASRLGLYWASFYQAHTGKDASESFADREMRWTTLDSFIRPQYGVWDHVTLGVEYGRRVILIEGAGVSEWAQNFGSWRWALMLNYHLEQSYFNNPVISLFFGESHKDRKTVYFPGRHAENNSHFIRINYEISIN